MNGTNLGQSSHKGGGERNTFSGQPVGRERWPGLRGCSVCFLGLIRPIYDGNLYLTDNSMLQEQPMKKDISQK